MGLGEVFDLLRLAAGRYTRRMFPTSLFPSTTGSGAGVSCRRSRILEVRSIRAHRRWVLRTREALCSSLDPSGPRQGSTNRIQPRNSAGNRRWRSWRVVRTACSGHRSDRSLSWLSISACSRSVRHCCRRIPAAPNIDSRVTPGSLANGLVIRLMEPPMAGGP